MIRDRSHARAYSEENMKNHALLVIPAVLALALTGCSGVKKDDTYEDAVALRAAVLKTGVDCPGERQEDNGHEGSIKCNSDLLLEVINDETLRKLAPVAMKFTGNGDAVLTGPNWLIQSDADTLAVIQKKLGGELEVI